MLGFNDESLAYLWQEIQRLFVKKVPGKGLSTEDYTTAEKEKLADLIPGGGGDSDMAWLPDVSPAGVLSWERSYTTVAPEPQSIKGPKGDRGDSGVTAATQGQPTFYVSGGHLFTRIISGTSNVYSIGEDGHLHMTLVMEE